jgi:hypothetical protein
LMREALAGRTVEVDRSVIARKDGLNLPQNCGDMRYEE